MKIIDKVDKQQVIEDRIDDIGDTATGDELVALLALHARNSRIKGKTNQFIIEFSESLGFHKHYDTAVRITQYLYPENKAYWSVSDEMYYRKVKNSGWLNLNNKNSL